MERQEVPSAKSAHESKSKCQVPSVWPLLFRARLGTRTRIVSKMVVCELYSTCASPVVPHPSTGHAYGCLASEIGRDPAFPTKYDRTELSPRAASPGARPDTPHRKKRMNVCRDRNCVVVVVVCVKRFVYSSHLRASMYKTTDPTTKA